MIFTRTWRVGKINLQRKSAIMRQNLRVSKQDTRCDHLTVGQVGQLTKFWEVWLIYSRLVLTGLVLDEKGVSTMSTNHLQCQPITCCFGFCFLLFLFFFSAVFTHQGLPFKASLALCTFHQTNTFVTLENLWITQGNWRYMVIWTLKGLLSWRVCSPVKFTAG